MGSDYSRTIKNSASALRATGGHIHRLGELTKRLPEKVTGVNIPVPKDTAPKSDGGFTTIDGHEVVKWIADIVLWVRHQGRWHGQVTSGYRSVADQREACRHVCGNPNGCPGTCAKPGTSNHQGKAYPGGAVDVSDYTTFGQEAAKYPHGPTVKNDLPLDRVHFSRSGH